VDVFSKSSNPRRDQFYALFEWFGYLSWDTCFPGTLAFLGHLLSWDTCFPGTLAFLGHLLSWDTCFPGTLAFPDCKRERSRRLTDY
jgi:hypothetical protein